ncbi:MAG: glycosyltransferase family 9 protein, partial [Chlamydiales bacterium]
PTAAFGPAKCWLPERFREVAKRLTDNPENHVLFFGDKAGAAQVAAISEGISPHVHNLSNKTSLRELIALIASCDHFLTNDSGPMHLAAALAVPLLALFGSTNEISTGPYLHGKTLHKHVSCSPCYRRTCPIDFRCMKQISVEEVMSELIP